MPYNVQEGSGGRWFADVPGASHKLSSYNKEDLEGLGGDNREMDMMNALLGGGPGGGAMTGGGEFEYYPTGDMGRAGTWMIDQAHKKTANWDKAPHPGMMFQSPHFPDRWDDYGANVAADRSFSQLTDGRSGRGGGRWRR